MTLTPTNTLFISFRNKIGLHDEISIVDKSGKIFSGIIMDVDGERIKIQHISSQEIWINKFDDAVFPPIRYKNPFNDLVSLTAPYSYFNMPLSLNNNLRENGGNEQFTITGILWWKDTNYNKNSDLILTYYKMANNNLYTQTLSSNILNNMSKKIKNKLYQNLRSYCLVKIDSKLLFINVFGSQIFEWDLKKNIFQIESNKSLKKLKLKLKLKSFFFNPMYMYNCNYKNKNYKRYKPFWSFIDANNNVHIIRCMVNSGKRVEHIKYEINKNIFIHLGEIKSDICIDKFDMHCMIYNKKLEKIFHIKLIKNRFKKKNCKICVMYTSINIDDINIKERSRKKWKQTIINTELENKEWNEKSFLCVIVYNQILIIEQTNVMLFIDLFDNYKLYKTKKFIKDDEDSYNNNNNNNHTSQILNTFNDYIHIINYKKEFWFKLFIKDIIPIELYKSNQKKINILINAYYNNNLCSGLTELIFNYYPLFIQC